MLRDYQIELSNQGAEILERLNMVYYVMEPRVGKTLTSFRTAELIGAKNVLFITTKKSISSIKKRLQRRKF